MVLTAPHPKKFTIEEYYKMAALGIFKDGDRLELIKGEIMEMSPVGLRHAACVNRLNRILTTQLTTQAIISIQNPIKLKNNTEPQPDVVVLNPREDFYETGLPTPKDILFLIEVADSSIDYDRMVKIPLYAENEIKEVWIVDLNQNGLEIYQKPSQNYYQIIQKLTSVDNIFLSNFPEIDIRLNQFL